MQDVFVFALGMIWGAVLMTVIFWFQVKVRQW